MKTDQKRRVRSQGNSSTNLDEGIQKKQVELPPQNFEVQFDNAYFKTQLCQTNHPLSHRKLCPFYHDDNDRRRDTTKYTYRCQLCPNGDNCRNGDDCGFSHNKVEQVYHPNRYKTKYCTSRDCEYGQYCSFAHSDADLNLPLKLHLMVQDKVFWMYNYKTVWCPHINKHERGICVYAHNAQDFRREPKYIVPVECPNWNKSDCVLQYDQGGCKDMHNCQFCHGWKELEYHPLIYKTKPCTAQQCKKNQKECAFYHNEFDKRTKKANPDGGWVIEEPPVHDSRKVPFRGGSNFNGPIIPKYLPSTQDNQHIQLKIELGAPLELFSQQSYAMTKASDSRKMSDMSSESYHTKRSQQIQQFQPTQYHNKKTRTAPVTPDQKNKQSTTHVKMQTNFENQYSKKLTQSISKKQEGTIILQILTGLRITESQLMLMDAKSIKELKLTESQIRHLSDTLSEIRIEKCDDELLRQAIDHDFEKQF